MKTQKKDEVIVEKNKKGIIPIVISIIVVLVVAAALIILFTINSSGKGDKLQEQLELGQKYLNELDYVQAIIAYETAIEIDPMSVDAYLGLANAYVAQGEYEKALEVLQSGYNLNSSDVLNTMIQKVKDKIRQDAEPVFEENISETNTESGNNISRPTYQECVLSEAEAEYLNQIIKLFNDGQYEYVAEVINYVELKKIVESYGPNFIYDNKKIYIEFHNFAGEGVSMLIIPLDAENGYGIHVINAETWSREAIIYGSCNDGFFNGEFTCIEETISDEIEIWEIKGVAINNILEGEVIYNNNLGGKYVHTYNSGYLEYSDLKEENGSISYCAGYWLSADGEKIEEYRYSYSDDYSIEWVKENVESRFCTIMDPLSRMGYSKDDWGNAYCPF